MSQRTQPKPGRHRRGRFSPALVALALCAALGLAVAQPGDTSAPPPAAEIPERVMAELRAANAARAERLEAEQAWALEAEKLQLLKSTVLREAERLKAAAAKARADEAELARRIAEQKAKIERAELVEAMVDDLAERLEKALAQLGKRTLPGLVPIDRAAGITDPPARLAAAVERLDQTERQTRKAGVELVAGMFGGQEMTVKLLRAGGVAAWWMSLDGKRAGQAFVDGDTPTLTPAGNNVDAEAIRKAFAVAEGQAAPMWSTLPAHHVKLAPKGDRP